MALTREQMDRKMNEHFAFEARDDVEGVLATLSPEVEHDIVGAPTGPTRGHAGARPFYEALFNDLSDSRVECTMPAARNAQVENTRSTPTSVTPAG